MNFNPPTPCGVGLCFAQNVVKRCKFQSTHPVWGGTPEIAHALRAKAFQSTHPVWGGTDSVCPCTLASSISIHPPRVGWDPADVPADRLHNNFNPPTPCGVGPVSLRQLRWMDTISIHPPRVGWDQGGAENCAGGTISIHPPRVGWDPPGI